MKFTLSWLKEHLETRASLDEIVTTLTKIGLEVESVEDKGKALSMFTIAHVISAEQHPNADKLRVCMVDTGDGVPLQVVCGAPNARAGLKTVFSPPGTYIPAKKITIAKGVIRGVESNGMMCSFAELDLSDDHDGIIELPADAPTGARYADYADLSDPVIEINLTPNRPDCTSIHGIARDLAAAGLGDVITPAIAPVAGKGACPVKVVLDLPQAPQNCPLFGLRLVRGVTNGPSPEWLQKKLKSIGLRPINALVDITNLLTFDRGRPLHVFDAAKVTGNLVVRDARDGETVLALDGREYTLSAGMTVIADDNGVVSIAGIMGGEATGCDETTTDVLIESALWDPNNIARTGRALGINSDARYRFERGIDPAFALPGLELATKLVLELCGGEASELEVAGAVPDDNRVIRFPTSEVARLTGADVPDYEIKVILQTLGFWLSGTNNDEWAVAPPSWRPDVAGKADLVEEVIRIAGLERVPATPLPRLGEVMGPVLTVIQKRTRAAKRLLAMRGMMEAVTWSFVPKAQALHFGGGLDGLDLANPISVEMSSMRPSLLPGLIAAAQRNADRGIDDVALFEVGQVFRGAEPGQQVISASGLRRALAKPAGGGRHWSAAAASVDTYDAKADASALLAAVGAPVDNLQITADAPAWYHPGRSGTFRLGPNVIGHFGELHPRTLEAMKVDGPLVAFEVTLDAIPTPKAKATRTKALLDLASLQPVKRDYAFIMDRKVAAGDVIKAAKGADKALVTRVGVFDLYEGPGVEEGKKSLAIEVTIQPRDKTLTDKDIEAVGEKIVAAVTKASGGSLRG